MPSRLSLLALAVALCAAGCTGGDGPSQPTGDATDLPSTQQSSTQQPPVPSPSPTSSEQTIRDVDLGAQTWVDVLRGGAPVTLVGGKATDGEFGYQLEDDVVIADADGDGHEDAFAILRRTRGEQVVRFGYVWLFDVATTKATQVQDPVGDWNACGDSLLSAEPGSPLGFELAERLRDHYDYTPCGVQPLHPRTRTVVVSKGRLVMSKPYLAYGGICYPTWDQATDLRRAVPIRVAPGVDADLVDRQQWVYPQMDDLTERTWPEGWIQVSWTTEQMKRDNAFWGICGFVWEK